jgi:acetylglutamate kinase
MTAKELFNDLKRDTDYRVEYINNRPVIVFHGSQKVDEYLDKQRQEVLELMMYGTDYKGFKLIRWS